MNSLYTTIFYLSIHWYFYHCLLLDNPCDILAPNGQFTGIGVHHQWSLDKIYANHYNDVYIMYRNGRLFWFNVTFSDNNDEPVIRLVMNKTDRYPISTIKWFSPKDIINQTYNSYNCFNEYKDNQNKSIKTVCMDANNTTKVYNKDYDPNDLMFSPVPAARSTYVYLVSPIVYPSVNTSSVSIKYYYVQSDVIFDHKDCDQLDCQIPTFVFDIDPKLWSAIDGIVGYNYGNNRKGWILFFKLNSKPYYCWTPLGQRLSEQCKNEINFLKYGTECDSIWSDNNSNNTNTTTDNTIQTTTTTIKMTSTTIPMTSSSATTTTTLMPISSSSSSTKGQSSTTLSNNQTDNIVTVEQPNDIWFNILVAIVVGCLILTIGIIVAIVIICLHRNNKLKTKYNETNLNKSERLPAEIRSKVGQMDTDWAVRVGSISTETINTKKSMSTNQTNKSTIDISRKSVINN
ncbi:uncharacterized protein LOC128956524 [Oppia nitens]|uniref:uncharacterized protein LOC128956524 n=1 Tax=Oppia nitens TaxID=1686743 RepID=UPI0023DBBBAD|nr:uncharacterized protein LOC128956524 [Oppia nitens]